MEMPHNTDAERVILGAIIVDNGGLPSAQASIRTLDFYFVGHRQIFEAMKSLAASGAEIDLVSLKRHLEAKGQIESAGGIAYLAGLVGGVPRLVDLSPWCAVVKECAHIRMMYN